MDPVVSVSLESLGSVYRRRDVCYQSSKRTKCNAPEIRSQELEQNMGQWVIIIIIII
jgi:hypothetical protein